jgi:hypothetical protein
MQINYNKPYNEFTIEEIEYLFNTFSDRVVIHNGRIVGFERSIEEEVI